MWIPKEESYWLPDGTRRVFSVYIMSNPSMTLYTGITNDLRRRVREHKAETGPFYQVVSLRSARLL